MGYLSKELLKKAYKTLSDLTPDHKQGQTQIVSAIRYVIALDMFYNSYKKNCDLGDNNNRNLFTSNVNFVVNVCGISYTANFYSTIEDLEDCRVGSNFYSAGVVAKSKVNTSEVFDYPTRGSSPLFRVKNNVLYWDANYLKNIANYLPNDTFKSAFIIWFLRNENIDNLHNSEIKKSLLNYLTQELVMELFPLGNSLDDFTKDFELDEIKPQLSSLDFIDLVNKKSYNSDLSPYSVKPKEKPMKETDRTQIYLSALRSKPFMILAGISGTGKSRIVREFAYMTCPKELQDKDGTTPGNYCMIEVKPNWHDSTELLGYYSAMNHEYMFTKFDRFVVKAWLNKDVPFFVCLDEMNLAPVEQYFAEFLSVLETRSRDQEGNIASGALIESQYFDDSSKMAQELGFDKATDQWAIKVREHIVKNGLTLPPNLMIIGTVNMDDTTYQFSRKVIDRAMTIEMNGGELKNMFGNSKNLQYRADPIGLSAFMARYLNADEVIDVHTDFANRIKEVLPQKTEDLNKILEYTPFQVSYRVLNELVIYTGVLLDEAKIKAEEIDFEKIAAKAFDQITLMKILPRIEGDEDMFIRGGQNVLDHLQSLFASESASHKKLTEMKERLDRTGFTRFWP